MTPRVRVGDVLQLQRRSVDVDSSSEYEEIGVRSFGKGIFHKEPVTGIELGNKRVFRIEPGDLVLSNVFAWEGAVAVATPNEVGKIGSHRFMTFTSKDERIDTAWAAWFFRSEPGLELIGKASPGSAGRNRTLAIERFQDLQVPLPTLVEQLEVCQYLAQLSARTAELRRLQGLAAGREVAVEDAIVARTLGHHVASHWPLRPLSDVADVNPRPDALQPDETVTFVPMSAVDAATGSVMDPTLRRSIEVGGGYKQFRQGDVIFARITPCMQNGKSAIFEGPTSHGLGSTEFHVLRPGPDAMAAWLKAVIRSRSFRDAAAVRFTGTAGQQRVPADFLRTVEIPVPPLAVQAELVERLASADSVFRSIARLRSGAIKLTESILPATLNSNFAGFR